MRAIVQRVTASSVTVDGIVVGAIGRGLNVLVGFTHTDGPAEIAWMARKCLELRLFPGEGGSTFDRSVVEIGGELLVVSQFTLYADARKGRRPSLDCAAPPSQAESLYADFVAALRHSGLRVETGCFGAAMQVAIANDGPVTIVLER